MTAHRSIACLILIFCIKQVACKVTDNTDLADNDLVEGHHLSSNYGTLPRHLSCSGDNPSQIITWSLKTEGQSIEIWSSDHPDTTTNDDLWSVQMIGNEAVLTIQATQEDAGEYVCSYGTYARKIEAFGQECDEDTEFTCNNGQCVPISWRCDGLNSCPGDEEDCFDECRGWTCDNGQCTTFSRRCDGIKTCTDGSDEEDCFDQCRGWLCNNTGVCVRESNRCDGIVHCDDGSDEENCDPCDADLQFACHSGGCIPKREICDGWWHCEDASDEQDCVCDEERPLECPSGGCIPASARCNWFYGCTDGSDEKGCVCDENNYWTCNSGHCLPIWRRCDGVLNCIDKSDEEGCGHEEPVTRNTYAGCNWFHRFNCPSFGCVPLSYVCDGIVDCSEGEDEANCATGTTMVEYPERPTTVDDIVNREETTQIPLGETGSHIDHPQCPLPDCAFISSSDFFSCTGPDQARIDAKDAWVAHPDENLPFLQIDLFRDVTVESIVTRGNGFNDEWTTVYSVAYRRDGSSSWIQDPAFYFANVDPNTPFINHLNNGPVSARYWRIYPLSFVGQRALRVDLLGPLDNCQGDFTCPSDKSHRLPLIANPECPLPLSQITSSSSLVRCSNAMQGVLPMVTGTCDTEELTPVQSPRLCNTWIPRADDTDSFIQFDLGVPTEVFEIITQGRGELINEFVNSYRVSYSDDGDNFYFIIDHILDQPQIFPGNTDSFSLVSNRVTTLPNPESGRMARYWRIHPVGFVGQPGLKVELLGIRDCP